MNKKGLAIGQILILVLGFFSFIYFLGSVNAEKPLVKFYISKGGQIRYAEDNGVWFSSDGSSPWVELKNKPRGSLETPSQINQNFIRQSYQNFKNSRGSNPDSPSEDLPPAPSSTLSPVTKGWKFFGSGRIKFDELDISEISFNSDTKVFEGAGSGEALSALGIPSDAKPENGFYVTKNKDGGVTGRWKVIKNKDESYSAIQEDGQVNTPFGPMGTWGGVGHMLEGLAWASAAYGIMGTIGSLFMSDDGEQLKAVQKSLFSGILAGKFAYGLLGKGGTITKIDPIIESKPGQWLHNNAPAISIGVGLLLAWGVYTHNYGKASEHIEQVNFQCLSWQAPHGGDDCKFCNDGELPCSEYRCKSLGQSCAIINKGTKFERCVNQNPRDTNPPLITPWNEKLTPGYKYDDVKSSPPGPGFKIIRTNGTNKCIKAFTPLEFGILTDEPAQCKIDIEYKDTFDSMSTYIGGDNIYRYNHSEYLSLPKAKDLKNSSINLEMGNEMTLYIRCRDSQGNMNQAPYAVRFCIDSAPDTTAPQIKATSIETGSCVAADQNSTQVSFYTDEPSQCKWGFEDQTYDSLPYNMSCTTQVYQINSLNLYTCTTELTAVNRLGTDYYIRCEDNQNEPKEDRNSMQQPFVFSLRGSSHLKLKSVSPNGTLYGGVSPMKVDLKAETLYGCNNNRAICFYSPTGDPNSYVSFFDTDKSDGIHTQRLDLYAGQHTYFIKCVDAGGNVAESNTTFNLDIDTTSPIITRAYFQEDYLKIVTARESDCVYSTEGCDYLFEQGKSMPQPNSVVHIVPWEPDKTFYIKCRDEFRNEPIDCSMKVKPKENFLYY